MTHIVITRLLPACNRGDLAIAQGMLNAIKHRYPNRRLTIFCRDPIADHELFRCHGDVEGEIFAPCNNTPGTSERARLWRCLSWYVCGRPGLDAPPRRFVQACKNADALLFCGGGSPGGYGRRKILRHALIPALLARRLNCPVIFTGLGLEPLRNPRHRFLTQLTLNLAQVVCMRDPASARIAHDLGVRTRVEIGTDWAVDLDPAPPKQVADILYRSGVPEPRGIRIVMNLRDEKAGGPEGKQRQGRYRELMFAAITGLLENADTRIVVVSMTHSRYARDDNFAASMRAVLPNNQRSRFHVLSARLMPAEIKGVIQTADIFIGTRLHPLVFALSSGIPSMAIHDFTKVRGFLESCSMERWLIDYSNAKTRDILETARELIKLRQAVAEEIAPLRPKLLARLSRNLDLINEVIQCQSVNDLDEKQ